MTREEELIDIIGKHQQRIDELTKQVDQLYKAIDWLLREIENGKDI